MQNIPSAKASEISYNEGKLRLALIHEKEATFRYAKTDDAPIETRTFVPTSVNLTKDGASTVVGHDEDRGATRSFRLDRIKGEVSIP